MSSSLINLQNKIKDLKLVGEKPTLNNKLSKKQNGGNDDEYGLLNKPIIGGAPKKRSKKASKKTSKKVSKKTSKKGSKKSKKNKQVMMMGGDCSA